MCGADKGDSDRLLEAIAAATAALGPLDSAALATCRPEFMSGFAVDRFDASTWAASVARQRTGMEKRMQSALPSTSDDVAVVHPGRFLRSRTLQLLLRPQLWAASARAAPTEGHVGAEEEEEEEEGAGGVSVVLGMDSSLEVLQLTLGGERPTSVPQLVRRALATIAHDEVANASVLTLDAAKQE